MHATVEHRTRLAAEDTTVGFAAVAVWHYVFDGSVVIDVLLAVGQVESVQLCLSAATKQVELEIIAHQSPAKGKRVARDERIALLPHLDAADVDVVGTMVDAQVLYAAAAPDRNLRHWQAGAAVGAVALDQCQPCVFADNNQQSRHSQTRGSCNCQLQYTIRRRVILDFD